MCDQQSLRSACAYAQSDQSLCSLLELAMSVKLLTEHYLEFHSLKRGCTDSSESTFVKMPHCWKSHVTAQMSLLTIIQFITNILHLSGGQLRLRSLYQVVFTFPLDQHSDDIEHVTCKKFFADILDHLFHTKHVKHSLLTNKNIRFESGIAFSTFL